jgi:hypothetical protein
VLYKIVGDQKNFCRVGNLLDENAEGIDNLGKLIWDKRELHA